MTSSHFSRARELFMLSLPTENRTYYNVSIKNAEDRAERAPCRHRVLIDHEVYEVDEIILDRLRLINVQKGVELLNRHMFLSGGFLESLEMSAQCGMTYINSIDSLVNLGLFPPSGVQALFPSLERAIEQYSKGSDQAVNPDNLGRYPHHGSLLRAKTSQMSRTRGFAYSTGIPLPMAMSAVRGNNSRVTSWGNQPIIPYSSQQAAPRQGFGQGGQALVPSGAQDLAPRQKLEFCPSWKLTGVYRPQNEYAIARAREVGLDPNSNYEGEISKRIIQKGQIPPHANCAVHISGIPVQATSAEILRSITEGKVFAFNRVDPNSRHPEAAANVTFIDRRTAERYMLKSQLFGIRICGSMVGVNWNRIAVGPSSNRWQSRVIRVTGPKEEISAEALEEFLHSRIVFELVGRSELRHAQGRKSATLSFCQILGQSRIAVRCLMQHAYEKGLDWVVSYSKDPCDPQDLWRH